MCALNYNNVGKQRIDEAANCPKCKTVHCPSLCHSLKCQQNATYYYILGIH